MTTTGGKCSIAMKKYLSIGKFLENNNAHFYEALDCLEMLGAIHPRMGKSITFLNPDKKLVDEIIKKAGSDDPEEAIEMVQSLILQGEYKTGADFEKFKSDIPTLYGSKLVVKGVKGDTVEIDGGKLTPSKLFKPYTRSRKGLTTTMIVWDLDGHVEYKKAPAADYSNLKKNHENRAKKGGNEMNANDVAADLTAYSRDNNSKVIQRLDQWASAADDKSKLTFKYVCTKSPLIDYLLIFCSGIFGTFAKDGEVKEGAYRDLQGDLPSSIDKSDQHFTACVGVNRGNSKKIADLYKSFDSDLKDTLMNGTDLYNLHAFIYYAYNALKCGQDDSSVNVNDMIIGCARDACGGRIRANGHKMLEPAAFGLTDAVDLSAYYQDFLAKVAFRAPISGDVVDTVKGAGEDDDDEDDDGDETEEIYSDFNDVMEDSGSFKMSESAMRELRNYMAAHGKCPLVR